VNTSIPKLLFDTCSIINLSYYEPVATIFRTRYGGNAGWTQAARTELVRQRGRRPPHPQAGKATNWAIGWLGLPIEISDADLVIATAEIQRDIAGGGSGSALDHLGEAASIALLMAAGTGRLITDDHAARGEARRPSSTRACAAAPPPNAPLIDGRLRDRLVPDPGLIGSEPR
jgi:hypothetical protein